MFGICMLVMLFGMRGIITILRMGYFYRYTKKKADYDDEEEVKIV